MTSQDNEQLARFLFHKREIAAEKRIARWQAFIPNDNGETSVAEVTGLAPPLVVELSRIVSQLRGLDALGHATFAMAVLPATGLSFVRDDDPFKRHGNLIGWPSGPGPAKARRISIAQQLSSAATLVTYEEPPGASNDQQN